MQKVRVRDGFQVQVCQILLLKVPISEPDLLVAANCSNFEISLEGLLREIRTSESLIQSLSMIFLRGQKIDPMIS